MAPVLLHLARASDDSGLAAPIAYRRLLQRWTSPEAISSPSESLPRSSASIFTRSALSSLFGRQSTTAIIPASYGNIDSGPSPGTVVGAVLGSVAGFILLLWLFYTCMSPGGWWIRETTESEVIVRRPHKSHSHRGSEKVEVRRSRSRPVAQETIIVEEERTRRSRSMSRSSASDEVVVIEEHSPPRKSKKKGRRDSGFRTVDPSAYGGVVGGNRRNR